MKYKSKELENELSFLRDNIIKGIKEGNSTLVSEGLATYKEMVKVFIDKLKQFNATYDRERALKECNYSIEMGPLSWPEIEWLRDNIREITDESFVYPRQSILSQVLFFPITIAEIALHEGEYYVFHKLVAGFPPYVYQKAIKIQQDEDLKNFIIDRIPRHLYDFGKLYIHYELDRSLEPERIDRIKDFTVGIILIFSQLLKTAYDLKRRQDFKLFKDKFIESFSMIVRESPESKILWLESQLNRNNLSDEEGKVLEKDIKSQKKIRNMIDEIDKLKKYALFGLCSWIVERYDNDLLTREELEGWYKLFGSFGDLRELTFLYYDIRKKEYEDLFGWDWWILDKHGNGKVVQIDFDRYLTRLYCIKTLEFLKEIPAEQRQTLAIPQKREIQFLAGSKDSPIISILNSLQQRKDKWVDVLGEDIFESIPCFLKLLNTAVKNQKREEEQKIIEASLDKERVEEFKKDLINGWKGNAELRRIIEWHGDFRWPGEVAPPTGFFGLNELAKKDVYVKNSGISIDRLGGYYGESLANGENELVFKEIMKALPDYGKVKAKEILPFLGACLKELKSREYNPIILVINSWFSLRTIEGASDFKPEPNRDSYKLGLYKNRPVINLHFSDDSFVVVVDLKKLGTWHQFKPKQLFPEEEYLADYLSFLLKPFDEKGAEEFIAKGPKFLKDKQTGKEKTKEEAVQELRQLVHLRVIEQFIFEVKDKNAGYKILTEERF